MRCIHAWLGEILLIKLCSIAIVSYTFVINIDIDVHACVYSVVEEAIMHIDTSIKYCIHLDASYPAPFREMPCLHLL